jgi:hypothetical protein
MTTVLEPRAKKIRERLVEVAAKRDTIHYDEVAELVGLSLANDYERERILPGLLGDISRAEHEQGRPLLSAVVVAKGENQQPGRGFFIMAREVGRRFDDDLSFFIEELNAVHGYWSKQRS